MKPWYDSTAIRGGMLVLIPAVLAFFHKQISDADLQDMAARLTLVICTAGPIFVYFGRKQAGGIGGGGVLQGLRLLMRLFQAKALPATPVEGPGPVTPATPKDGPPAVVGLVLALSLILSGCTAEALKGLSLTVSPAGVTVAYNTPEWEEQLAGVDEWTNWLAQAPLDEKEKHLPGLAAWTQALDQARQAATGEQARGK